MASNILIPRHLREKIDRELESGEHIKWIGMPIPRYFTPISTSSFLFAIPWTAFAIFWVLMVVGFQVPNLEENGARFVFSLFGLPFVLIGLGMLSSPIWTYRKFLKTVYAITDKRAITLRGGRTTAIRSYPPEMLQDIHRKEKRNGSGDVLIGQQSLNVPDLNHFIELPGFFRIRDPQEVERMLKELAAQAKQGV